MDKEYSIKPENFGLNYDELYQNGREPEEWFNGVPEFIQNYGKEILLGDNHRILDLGCGQGRNLVKLAKQDFLLYGVDQSQEGLRWAKANLKAEMKGAILLKENFLKLSFEENFFKAIFANVSLHNLGSPENAKQAFSEAARVLTNNGLFYVSVCSKPREPKAAVPERLGDSYYSKEFLEELARENSLKIVEMREQMVIDEKNEDDKVGFWEVVFRKVERQEEPKQ